ncbi:MAG: cytochrome c maturation protein CcmE [Bacteroidetes bacterium]|nr:cytochrome c maturation protein CcmE [Bacteroidota bacterium]
MKKVHIIGIVVIAIALAVIVSTISNSSTYAPFRTAIENEGSTFHIVGKLNKDKEFIYNPEVNANLFGFYLVDNEGLEKKVLFNGSKPQDFERSEQIVVIGKMSGDEFHASQILMKCPSKYNGNQQDQLNAVSDESETES